MYLKLSSAYTIFFSCHLIHIFISGVESMVTNYIVYLNYILDSRSLDYAEDDIMEGARNEECPAWHS